MSRMSTGTRSQAPVRCTRSAAKPPTAASAKPARARVTPSEAPCSPAPGLARDVATTTMHQGAETDGQDPAQQRLAAGPGPPQGGQRRQGGPGR